MALSHSPRKLSQLTTGNERSTLRKPLPPPPVTRRVFFCGVVVEGSEHGAELPPDVQDLVASLGDPIDLEPEQGSSQLPSATESCKDLPPTSDVPHPRKRATTITSSTASGEPPPGSTQPSRKRASTNNPGLTDIINELVATERSYVKRLRTLKTDYADPLRTFSRSKETAIIPSYEAKTLFGNIDQLLPVNEAFLADLEKMVSADGHEVGGIGDVALEHFRERRGFENYKQYYAKREEAQAIFEREVRKASGSGFAAFIDRIKYAGAADNRNRVGLRELLMEPIQRIPRYTLLFRQMIKQMPAHDPQRPKLIEADELASRIAAAEIDEQTKRAAIMYCLRSSIDDFPPALVSNSRRFVDCIDVEDVPIQGTADGPATPGGSGSTLHCSLLLFDDKLVIVKRPGSGEKSARALTGLDDLDKVTKLKGLQSVPKKTGMVCKGVVEVTDVVATNVGGSDFHLYLESLPTGQTDRWAGRPFRAYTVVLPPAPAHLDPLHTETAKSRFLENLWAVQARYRTKEGQSVLLCAEDQEVESRAGRVTIARTYFNIYQRTAFLQEKKKTKIVMHIDPLGSADPIAFGTHGPFVVVRIQPMAGELARYTVTSHHAAGEDHGEEEEDIIQTARVPGRIIQTIHQYGLFTFKTGNTSMPSTPGGTTRTRATIFALDAISRNLFHARPTVRPDIFGGSINTHRRPKATVTSRSSASAYAPSTSTRGSGTSSSVSRFTRSRSTSITTATTSLADIDDHRSYDSASRSSRRQKKPTTTAKQLPARPRSPVSAEESEPEPVRSESRASSDWYTDNDDGDGDADADGDADLELYADEPTFRGVESMDESERDLVARLALARRNSQTQGETQFGGASARPTEETIYEYEDEPPQPLGAFARTESEPRESYSHHSTATLRPPDDEEEDDHALSDVPESSSRPESRSERRPLGPRSLSPLPQPVASTSAPRNLPSLEDLGLEEGLRNLAITSRAPTESGTALPRSRRQPFDVSSTAEGSPRRVSSGTSESLTRQDSINVAPLQVRKKAFASLGVSPYRRRPHGSGRTPASPHANKSTSRRTSLRRTSSQIRNLRTQFNDESEKLFEESDAVRAKLESSRQLIKKLRATYEQARVVAAPADQERSTSPVKGLRPVQRMGTAPMTKEARARMEEMQRLISKRSTDSTPRRPIGFPQDDSPSQLPETPRDGPSKTMNDVAVELEGELENAIAAFDSITSGLRTTLTRSFEISKELVQARSEASSQQRQHECVRQLLSGAMAEMAVLYDSFNEELDKVFWEISLPEGDAWVAVAEDLRQTKMIKQTLEGENKQLEARLAEEQSRSQAYLELLKKHGIISQDPS